MKPTSTAILFLGLIFPLAPGLVAQISETTFETGSRVFYGSDLASFVTRNQADFGSWTAGFELSTVFREDPVEYYLASIDSPAFLIGAVRPNPYWTLLNNFDVRAVRPVYSRRSVAELQADYLEAIETEELWASAGFETGDSALERAQWAADSRASRPGLLEAAAFGQETPAWGTVLTWPAFASAWIWQTVEGDAKGWAHSGTGFEHSFLMAEDSRVGALFLLDYGWLDTSAIRTREESDWWLDKPMVGASQVVHGQAGLSYTGEYTRAGLIAQGSFAPFLSPGLGAAAWFGALVKDGHRRMLGIDVTGFVRGDSWIDTYGHIVPAALGGRIDLQLRPFSWLVFEIFGTFGHEGLFLTGQDLADDLPHTLDKAESGLSFSAGPEPFYATLAARALAPDLSGTESKWTMDASLNTRLSAKLWRFSARVGGRVVVDPFEPDRYGIAARLAFAYDGFGFETEAGVSAPGYYFKGWGEDEELDIRLAAALSADFGERKPRIKLALGLADDTDYAELSAVAEAGFFSVFEMGLFFELTL